MRIACIFCICLVISSPGCSISFMDTVPMQWTPSQKVKCDGYALPVIDTTLAVMLGSLMITGMIELAGEEGAAHVFLTVLGATPLYMLAGSAATGWYWGYECYQVDSLRDDWLKMGTVEQEKIEERWREKKGLPPVEDPL